MAKRLCKLSRKQVAHSLGEIEKLVAEPKFVCRSCARASHSKQHLCKPASIAAAAHTQPTTHTPKILKPLSARAESVLFAPQQAAVASAPSDTQNVAQAIETKREEQKAQAVQRVIARVKARKADVELNTLTSVNALTSLNSLTPLVETLDLMDKKAFKKARKELKRAYKQQKKWLKTLKKQQKLSKKQAKLQAKLDVMPTWPTGLAETEKRQAKVH